MCETASCSSRPRYQGNAPGWGHYDVGLCNICARACGITRIDGENFLVLTTSPWSLCQTAFPHAGRSGSGRPLTLWRENRAIRETLDANGFDQLDGLCRKVRLAFTVLFARPRKFHRICDRPSYQMDSANARARCANRPDIDEVSDIVLVNRPLPYLDILGGCWSVLASDCGLSCPRRFHVKSRV